MRIDRKYKPELCVSKDITRENLTHLHLDTEAKKLVATNGHMLVAVPVTDLHDTTGAIPVKTFKAAKKMMPSGAVLEANGTIKAFPGPVESPRPVVDYPPWKQVVPAGLKEGAPGTYTIALNANYIADLAAAIGSKGVVHLTMFIEKGDTTHDPILVTDGKGGEAFGLVMPCRK